MPRRLSSVLAAFPLLLTACATTGGPSRDLALRHVVLYQNGIGYFERSGVLREERLRLRLREREMDDVLKTLVVVERGKGSGGKPSTVTALLPQVAKKGAEAKDPEEATWLDVVLSPHPAGELSLAYAVPTAAWKAAYRVVLPDEKDKSAEAPAGAARPRSKALLQAWALVDNVSDEDWNDVQLSLATGAPFTFSTHLRDVRFVDRPEVSLGDLTPGGPRGLVLAERTRGVDSDHDGIPDSVDACPNEPGEPSQDPRKSGCPQFVRRIVGSSEIQILNQVHFAPDSAVIPAQNKPMIDEVVRVLVARPEIGRLRVEGHTDNREKNADALAARRAQAVVKYLADHGVDPARLVEAAYGSARPIADNARDDGRQKNRRVEFHIEESSPPPPPLVRPEPPPPPVVTAENMARTGAGSAVPRPAPGMIRYDIVHPVTLPKSSTTMVTIVNEYIPGEDVLLFRPEANAAGSDRHPFHAARIENESGFAFQAGPVAIFGGGTFVGEGIIDALARKQVAFIPYGLDADATVRAEQSTSSTPLRVIAASKGALLVEEQVTLTTRYHVTVGDRPPARLFVRHPRASGYEPDKPGPDAEVTDEALLVPVAVASGWKGEVAVDERRKQRELLPVLGTEAKRLEAYLAGSKLEPAAEKKLREMVALRGELGRREVEMSSLRTRLGDLAGRMAELRASLASIEKTPRAAALQQKLLDRLGEATKESEDLSRKLADGSAAAAEARAKLTEGLRELVIEEQVEKAKP